MACGLPALSWEPENKNASPSLGGRWPVLEIHHLITGASPMGNSDENWVQKEEKKKFPSVSICKRAAGPASPKPRAHLGFRG